MGISMKVKLISTETKIIGWEYFNDILKKDNNFTLNHVYEVIKMETSREEDNIPLGLKVINNDGEPNFIPNDCIEIIDNTIPEFWVDQDYYGTRFLAPLGWDGTFFSEYQDGNTDIRERFYREYQDYYKQPTRLSKKSKLIENVVYVRINSKRAYLKPTEKELEFIFLTNEDNLYNEKEFGLSFDKLYEIYEVKNYDDYWYKVRNDNNIELFYPRYIFTPIKNEAWYKFSTPYLTNEQIRKIIRNNRELY